MRRAARVGVLAVLAALFSLSCEPPVYTTIEWQEDGNDFVQYSTNDPQYYNTAQYLPLAIEHETPMTTVTATVKKMYGSSVGGFGIVFCYVDENNFYRLLITTEGKYNVWEMENGVWKELVAWKDSTNLNTGMDEENTIGVTQDPLHTFTVTFNTLPEPIFSDASLTGGDAGPCMWVGSYAEDARFRMDAPQQYPPP